MRPDARASVRDPGGAAVSYAGLAARADRYGRGLQELGLRPGDCVAGMLPNSTDTGYLRPYGVRTRSVPAGFDVKGR